MGFIGSGKSTVATTLEKEYGFIIEAFASVLKDAVAAIFGWSRELLEGDTATSRAFRDEPDTYWSNQLGERITPRLILQRFGTEVCRNKIHEDIWIQSLKYRLQTTPGDYVVTDVRFVNEMQAIRDMGGHLIDIERVIPDWFSQMEPYFQAGLTSDLIQEKFPKIHRSEWDRFLAKGIYCDYKLYNVGTVDQLKADVMNMIMLFTGPTQEKTVKNKKLSCAYPYSMIT